MRREKSYRGISKRLAIHYLTNLGGEQVDDDTVEAAEEDEGEEFDWDGDWTATLDAEKVGVGSTLTLTEVTVVFEGDEDVLDPLIERFGQKAMRAGG